MKVTLKQLRKIIREELINEYDPMNGPFWNEPSDFDDIDSKNVSLDELPDLGIHSYKKEKNV
jgi:hypothetical protein